MGGETRNSNCLNSSVSFTENNLTKLFHSWSYFLSYIKISYAVIWDFFLICIELLMLGKKVQLQLCQMHSFYAETSFVYISWSPITWKLSMFINTLDLISRRTRLLSSLISSFNLTLLLCFKHYAQPEAIVGGKKAQKLLFNFRCQIKDILNYFVIFRFCVSLLKITQAYLTTKTPQSPRCVGRKNSRPIFLCWNKTILILSREFIACSCSLTNRVFWPALSYVFCRIFVLMSSCHSLSWWG